MPHVTDWDPSIKSYDLRQNRVTQREAESNVTGASGGLQHAGRCSAA